MVNHHCFFFVTIKQDWLATSLCTAKNYKAEYFKSILECTVQVFSYENGEFHFVNKLGSFDEIFGLIKRFP